MQGRLEGREPIVLEHVEERLGGSRTLVQLSKSSPSVVSPVPRRVPHRLSSVIQSEEQDLGILWGVSRVREERGKEGRSAPC